MRGAKLAGNVTLSQTDTTCFESSKDVWWRPEIACEPLAGGYVCMCPEGQFISRPFFFHREGKRAQTTQHLTARGGWSLQSSGRFSSS